MEFGRGVGHGVEMLTLEQSSHVLRQMPWVNRSLEDIE